MSKKPKQEHQLPLNPQLANNILLGLPEGIVYTERLGNKEDWNRMKDLFFGKLEDEDNVFSRRTGGVLQDYKKYVFEEYEAYPIRKQLYPGVKDTPWVIVGLRFEKPNPIRETYTEWRFVKDCFSQLEVNNSHKAPTKIYLPKVVAAPAKVEPPVSTEPEKTEENV